MNHQILLNEHAEDKITIFLNEEGKREVTMGTPIYPNFSEISFGPKRTQYVSFK